MFDVTLHKPTLRGYLGAGVHVALGILSVHSVGHHINTVPGGVLSCTNNSSRFGKGIVSLGVFLSIPGLFQWVH